jgi:PWI domain
MRRGVDVRFKDKEAAVRRSIAKSAPAAYGVKLDMSKIRLWAVKEWVKGKLRGVLGMEDEIVEGMVMSMLEASKPDPVEVESQLQPFLDKDTRSFVEELWLLLASAQSEPTGVPRLMLEARQVAAKSRVASVEATASRVRADIGSTFVKAGSEGGSASREVEEAQPAKIVRIGGERGVVVSVGAPDTSITAAIERARALIEGAGEPAPAPLPPPSHTRTPSHLHPPPPPPPPPAPPLSPAAVERPARPVPRPDDEDDLFGTERARYREQRIDSDRIAAIVRPRP